MASFMENNSFLFGANEAYISELYAQFLKDSGSVDADWAEFFCELDDDTKEFLKDWEGASWSRRETSVGGCGNGSVSMSDATVGMTQAASPQAQYVPMPMALPDQIRQATTDSLRALMLIRNYRVRGHLHANLDPLVGLSDIDKSRTLYQSSVRLIDIDLGYVHGTSSVSHLSYGRHPTGQPVAPR